MINAIYKTNGETHDFSVRGHADYASHGNDIVCAAVSGIMYALIGWLENNNEYVGICDIDIGSGNVHIFCDGTERAAAVFDMASVGLEQIAYKYPDHVSIDITDIDG